MTAVYAMLILLMLAGFILTGAARFAVCMILLAVFCCIDRLRTGTGSAKEKPLTKSDRIKHLLCALLLCAVPFWCAPLTLHTSQLWRWPFQRALLGVYNTPAAWFPDFQRDVQSDFAFDYLPGMMQGTGHESVRFVTSPARAAEIEKQFAELALYQSTLPADQSGSFPEIPEQSRAAFPAAAGGWDGTADFWFDRDFWFADGSAPADAKVYYLDARGSWNHPGCSAVIVSSQSGRVEYVQYGYTELADEKN